MMKKRGVHDHEAEYVEHTLESEWMKERGLYLVLSKDGDFQGALKVINRELEDQKRVSEELKKRVIALESQKQKEDKKPGTDATHTGKHRKTNSELVRNLAEQTKDDKKKPTLICHKAKNSLEDYVLKKAQYKLRRSKKEASSASYGGYGNGKLFCSGESHGNAGGSFGRPFTATVAIVSKISPKGPLQSTAVTSTTVLYDVPFRDAELYSISEDNNTHVSVLSDTGEKSNVTAVRVTARHGAGDSTSKDFEPEELTTTTRREEDKSGIYSLGGRTFCGDCDSSTVYTGEHHTLAASVHSPSVLAEKCVLRAHMDGVRDVQFSSVLNYLMTVSEDCMVKLWDIKNLKKNGTAHPGRVEPCFTYRGHTGTLFACCVGGGLQQEDHFLYSAGSEGVIRIWSIPSLESSKFPTTNGKNYCVGLWTSHRDVVWQLVHHPTEPLLLSVSSDGTVKVWKDFDISQYPDSVDKNSSDCLLGAFVYKSSNKKYYEIPTSAAWVRSAHSSLLVSYVSPMLGLFDRVTVVFAYERVQGKIQGTAKFDTSTHLKATEQQTNKLISHPGLPLAITAHENGLMRFFDLATLKLTKTVNAHTEGVSAIANLKDGHYLMTGGYDGVVKCWDVRKYQCVSETKCHDRKYGEGVHAIAVHSQMPFVATGGADCAAKVFVCSL